MFSLPGVKDIWLVADFQDQGLGADKLAPVSGKGFPSLSQAGEESFGPTKLSSFLSPTPAP